MKAIGLAGILAAASAVMAGEPLRVALLDFDNQASVSSDAAVVGGVTPKALTDKGVFALGALLANDPAYVLIDRREFISQIQSLALTDNDKKTSVKPSFLRAAQAVNADVVLRGNLLSYSPGKETVNQGGIKTEFQTLTLRVSLQALDTRDGTVIAMMEGAANRSFRQSDVHQTVVGEDELVQLLQSALAKAVPALNDKLQARLAQQNSRPKVKLSIKAGAADPAMVEIDGMLIGTTPLANFQVYAGDHVITIGKAGYQDISKQILLQADTAIEVPLFRTKLSAEEMKEVLDKARVNVIAGTGGVEPAWIINTIDSGK
ncbi:MAG: PEGA domain-containing protein [Verrucomicrobia bacterium]|nr:PEGA domain-containing protein [Verrucomicrobiota bacterium]MBU4292029.1 PEGA domain-containing protein [Verrucomicrobiota bacterium]MBU4427917.1 PEGA domain-containing protein [Verrucomicrobiota bacterium]MCG2678863.1 PEGA domain-containing protein [Kiritimatiellia bacterium]